MKGNRSYIAMLFVFAATLYVSQFIATSAQAQSSYFTARGCVDCHSAPTVATCAGCHHHSGTLAATKNKTTDYAPGETVTITLASTGARSGWIGVRLYDQSGVEIARSSGNQSGMGGSTTFGAASAVSAPAPTAAGNYTWRIAYFGNEDGVVGDVHSEISVNVPITVASATPPADTAAPVVTFALPATATSLTVPVSGLSATDNVGVTGYLITSSATAPAASAAGWLVAAPASVTAVAGSNTFYAWAKDAAGNVSAVKSATVVVTLPDTAAPVVTFALPATATSLTVPVSSLSATDNIGVTGYLITSSATAPAASAAGWTATAPASVTAVAGSNTFYAWAKDAAGNVSAVKSATVVVTLPDTAAPVVTFALPATATSLSVPVSSLSATDNIGVTGYLITSSATAPAASAAGWTATAPASVTAVAGSNTFYAWAKDAAGNVSAVKSATVVVTLPDTAAPVVTFALPATATSLSVPVSSLSATDNIGVTGYLITSSATAPAASAAGWLAAAPASVTAVEGSNTFYAWAKDAAGNVSAVKSATVVVTLPDTAAPVVTFALPATATNLTVPVSSLSATDNIGVTGYLITSSATAPAASAAGWLAAAPASVTAVEGSNTFYAWAKDAAGNVSTVKSATVVVTLPDTAAPVVTFALPATAANLTVPVSSFSATDNIGVTGYLITSSATAPAASAAGWLAAAPASVTAVAGSNTFYAWAKDAAGNVSAVKSATVVVTLPDTAAPVVTFALPATATNLTVPVSSLSATDNIGVTGYLITSSATAPAASAAGWLAAAPAVVTAVEGSNTFYAWAKDAAGNVSAVKSATVTVTLAPEPPAADTTKPSLTISALADGTLTNKVTLNISGTASDAGGLQNVTVNAQIITVQADGSFSTALTLLDGANTITVVATDKAGNQTSDSRTVTFDANAPVLTIAAPADNSATTETFITLTGTINESSTVSFSVNDGSPQSAAINGSTFSATANLVVGINTITITATDLAGNITTAKRTVTCNATYSSPELAVTSPNQDITTRKSFIVLKGKVADNDQRVTVKIKMNGRTYTPKVDDGEFKQRLTFSKASLYAITVTATDEAGNSSSIVRNVIYRPLKKGDDERNRRDDD